MRIDIKEGNKSFCIRVPNVFLFNSFGARFIKFEIKGAGKTHKISIPPKSMKNVRRCVREMKKLHADWNMIEVYDPDGSTVKIKL